MFQIKNAYTGDLISNGKTLAAAFDNAIRDGMTVVEFLGESRCVVPSDGHAHGLKDKLTFVVDRVSRSSDPIAELSRMVRES